MRPFDWDAFRQAPLVAILRGFRLAQIPPLVGALRDGGITTLEVTMNSDDACGQIREALAAGGGRLNVGAGTVTGVDLLRQALDAGASFVVTPALQRPVLGECVRRGVPVFPGALSPTEVIAAWEAGASAVKVFPAEHGGPAFLRALKESFPECVLMPTGGVDLESLPKYRDAGAGAFGVGSPLFNPKRVAAGDWDWLRERSRLFVEAWREGPAA